MRIKNMNNGNKKNFLLRSGHLKTKIAMLYLSFRINANV